MSKMPETSRTGKAARGKNVSPRSKRSAASTTSGSTALLSRDLREFVGSLNRNQVQYLIVGVLIWSR
jgi:hypothetical protein